MSHSLPAFYDDFFLPGVLKKYTSLRSYLCSESRQITKFLSFVKQDLNLNFEKN